MNNFNEQIRNIDVEKNIILREIVIPLDTATNDKLFSFSGDVFYLSDATDVNVSITARFNDLQNEPIEFTKGLGWGFPFKKVFLTWAAQSGKTANILIGNTGQSFGIMDNRSQSQIASVLETIRDDLRGDTTPENWGTEKTVGTSATSIVASNTGRKSAFCQSKSTNTGKIYIGFDNTVTATKWIAELLPGDFFGIDDYRGDIYAISDTAGQKLGYAEI